MTQPSDVVVMENVIRPDTQGIQPVDAKYDPLKRGQYVLNVNPNEIRPVRLDRNVPLDLYEAECGADCSMDRRFAVRRGDFSEGE